MRPFRPTPLQWGLLLLAPLAAACVGTENPEGWAEPVRDGDVLFASLDRGELSSLTFTEGGPIQISWTFPSDVRESEKDLDTEAIYPAPIIQDGRIVIATHAEGVFSLDPLDGRILWRREGLGKEIVSAFAETPSGDIAVGTADGFLHVIDSVDGRTVDGWPTTGVELPAGIWASLALDSDTVYAATMDGDVFAFALSDGSSAWSRPFETSGAVLELALLPNGRLFVPSLDRKVYLLDPATGESVTSPLPVKDWVWMKPTVEGHTAYFGDLSGRVYSLDINTGILNWTSDLGDRIKASPILLGELLLVVDRSPTVHFLTPATGDRVNSVPLDAKTVRAPLLVTGDTVLVLSTDGKLFRARVQPEPSVIDLNIGSAQ
ncbi:MAG TPA: PQQ-binding-like beta-propeller repeat protein [Dehalococcoidia bacterium]|nr:PQQ-binding-like beta-propeller repeat protein [Dehalococcoidia bacterium]